MPMTRRLVAECVRKEKDEIIAQLAKENARQAEVIARLQKRGPEGPEGPESRDDDYGYGQSPGKP